MNAFLTQLWVVSGVLLNMAAQGMVLSYASSLLPALKAADSPVQADLATMSWLSSSVGLAGIPGLFISSYLMDIWGRKITQALIIMPAVIGWVLIYYATSVPVLMIGRISTGMTCGGSVCLGAVVIGECSSPNNRGMFLNLKTAAVCLGSMLVHILSNFFNYRMIALFAILPNIIAILNVLTWKESPSFLAAKKNFVEAEKSFFWLRGKDENSVRELNELIKAQMNEVSEVDKSNVFEDMVRFFRKFKRRDFVIPIIIISTGCILLEVTGRHFFPAYAFEIIGEVTGSKAQSFYYTLALDLIITFSSTFSSILVRMMKRRTLLFATGFAAITILGIVCSYLYLASLDVISKDRAWIPISLFVVYFILVNLGCTPIPLALLGEVLPLAHKGAGSTIAGILLSVCVYLGLQVTPFLLHNTRVYGTFAIYGITMLLLLLILYFTVPETKDRTLQEIEDYFNFGRFKKDDEYMKEEGEELKVRMLSENEVKI